MGDSEHTYGEPIEVLYVGSKRTANQLSAVADERSLPVTVRHHPPDEPLEQALSEAFECFVLSDCAEPDWETVTAIDRPVVRYGGVEGPDDLEGRQVFDAVLARRTPPDGRLLFEKISALVGRSTPHSTLSDALDAVDASDRQAAAFLIDAEGRVGWSSTDLSSLLPAGEPASGTDGTFYDRLSALFHHADRTELDWAPGPSETRTGRVLTAAPPDHSRYYRHYSYPTAVDGIERVEFLQDVTTTVGNHDRLVLFEDLVENAEDGLFVLNADWQVEYLNRSCAEMLGYDRDELVGAHAAEQLSPEEMRSAQAATERLVYGDEGSAVMDFTLERGDGTEIDVSVHIWPRYTDNGRYAGLMGAARDITERKERERELERYETIIQAVGDPVCTFDAEGRFVYVNDAFEERTGYDIEELRGRPATYAIDEGAVETSRRLIDELRADDDRTTATFEMDLPTEGEETVPVECQIALLPDEDGTFQGSVAVLRDISRLKRREERLSKFATVVSHDLRNPLDVALGRAEVLPEIADLDPETETHVTEIHDSLKRMEGLIQDVLALTRQRDGDVTLSTVSLDSVAEDAWSNVETEQATLVVADSADVRAHRSRLLRLFENLFRNAIEHGSQSDAGCEEGGDWHPTVEVGTLATDADRGRTGFYVADDGPGIPDEERDSVFNDGFTTTAAGTGLGLTIVREIAQAHGWSIDLADSIDGGVRFEFSGLALATETDE